MVRANTCSLTSASSCGVGTMIIPCSADGGVRDQGTERCPTSPAGKGQCWVWSSDRLAQSLCPSHCALFLCMEHVHICLYIHELSLGS